MTDQSDKGISATGRLILKKNNHFGMGVELNIWKDGTLTKERYYVYPIMAKDISDLSFFYDLDDALEYYDKANRVLKTVRKTAKIKNNGEREDK